VNDEQQRLSHSQWAGLRKSTQSELCRTDRPYTSRLKPAHEALPPVSPAQNELPGKDSESLSGGSRGQSPLAARANASGELRSEATQQTSSLDTTQINRNRPESDELDWLSAEYALARTRERFSKSNILGRRKFCGLWVMKSDALDGRVRIVRVNCKCWDCSYCGPRKAKRYKRAIRRTAEEHRLARFLTLTVDPAKIGDDNVVRFINKTFAKWRVSLKRNFGVTPKYIRILEFQQNGNPHFHILIDRYVPHSWIVQSWSAVGGGRIINIKYVDIHRVSRYLSKYLTKELLLSAPKRSRRVTTSRSLHLMEKKNPGRRWILFKISIFWWYARLGDAAQDVHLDEEGILESFSYVPQAV
jgi:hypothetical protein